MIVRVVTSADKDIPRFFIGEILDGNIHHPACEISRKISAGGLMDDDIVNDTCRKDIHLD